MAELSGFWTTTGTPSGDQQASYTQAQLASAHKVLAACSGFEGVAPGYLNKLACTDGGANTVDVDTGGAMVDGLWYYNDASQSVNVPSASGGGNTRIDRIVLRADWANFNVSVHRIGGVDAASPSAPAITQTSGTTYDVKLCQALVDTGGNITVTDERTWARPVFQRQGGSATNWRTDGTTNYTPADYKTYVGVAQITISDGNEYGLGTVTFPSAFSGAPVAVVTVDDYGGLVTYGTAISTSTTELNIQLTRSASTPGATKDVHWMAIGPA